MPGISAWAVASRGTPAAGSCARAGATATTANVAAASQRQETNSMLTSRPPSGDVGQDAVELVEAVIGDHELARARRGMLQLDRCAELVGEVVLEPLDSRASRAPAGLA